MRWHFVSTDKTYLHSKKVLKKLQLIREILAKEVMEVVEPMEPITSQNQLVTFKSINNYSKSSHHRKITVYLDRIHQYLCAVKFW